MEPIQLPTWLAPLALWFKHQPIAVGLVILMLLDIMSGLALSVSKKTLRSSVSWRGMCKKAITLMVLGACAVLQQFVPQLPILNMAALFYTITEGLSILEHAAAAGVPLPAGLVDALSKIKDQQRVLLDQKKIEPKEDKP